MKALLTATAAIASLAGCVVSANWLIQNLGTKCIPDGPCLIPVGFGLMAPSGVLMIGAALVLRDYIQERFGSQWVFAAVAMGVAATFATSPAALAIASAVAFGVSELFDWSVYSALRRRGKALAVFASQAVGAAIDSAIFVYLAFGSLEFSAGTTLAKIYAGAAVALVLLAKEKKNV